jgi:DNA-binding transcriptional LysR family regulator
VLVRFGQRHPRVTVDVRIVPDLGRGIAGEVADGRADVGVVSLPVYVEGLVSEELYAEPYVLAHPAGHPDPRSLPMIDWHENCSGETRRWLAGQEWIPPGDITVEDDGVVMSMVGHGLGAAIVPRLSAVGAPPKVATTELGDGAPLRRVGYVTTRELAGSALIRDLLGELRTLRTPAPA